MNVLNRMFHTLRVWTGLADASESRLTPDHGWLLASPAFVKGQVDTTFLERELASRNGPPFHAVNGLAEDLAAVAVALEALHQRRGGQPAGGGDG